MPRAHLVEQLQQGMARALILVSAPAGFGKTTLLAQWLAESGTPAAWLSLEPEDNDPARFLSYLIAALQTFDAQLGTTALALLHTPQPPLPEAVLAILVSEVTSRGAGEFALVLDDYHVITASLTSGKLIVNPGSVGLPAYTMETPIAYAMESGSSHARYALLHRMQNAWQVEHVQLPYASRRASMCC